MRSVDTVSWVLNAYNIMFAVLLVSMGRLADQFGRRRFFLIGMTIFTIGSLLCALSWSIDALIAFRVVQAVGAGILAPIALATTALVFPPAQRGLGLAMMAVVANGAAVLGPPIGGVLVELASWPWDAGWHWIFLINVPIGVVGIALAMRVCRRRVDPYAGTNVDWWGMATLGVAIFCLTFGLVEGNQRGLGLAGDRLAVRRRGVLRRSLRAHAALRPLPDADSAPRQEPPVRGGEHQPSPVRRRDDGHAVPDRAPVREPVGLLASSRRRSRSLRSR